MGAVFAPTRFSLVRLSIPDLVADGKSLVRNSGVGGGGQNRILIEVNRNLQRILLSILAIHWKSLEFSHPPGALAKIPGLGLCTRRLASQLKRFLFQVCLKEKFQVRKKGVFMKRGLSRYRYANFASLERDSRDFRDYPLTHNYYLRKIILK